MDIYIDAETHSEVRLRTKDGGVGAYAYAAHPSTRPILWSVHHEGLPRPLVLEEPDLDLTLCRMRLGGSELTLVHWGAFDTLILSAFYKTPIQYDDVSAFLELPSFRVRVRDLSGQSLAYGAPGGLAEAAKFWLGAERKDPGKKLIDLFCGPEPFRPQNHPVAWEQFRSYAGQDAALLHPIAQAMATVEGGVDMAAHWPAQAMVARMNDRGAPVDLDAVRCTIDLLERAKSVAVDRCLTLTGCKPTQLAKLGAFLGLPDMQAPTVQAFIAETTDPIKREVAELQQSVAGAAVKKLYVLERMAAGTGRARGCFQYHGAHTRRLTSHDAQLHNFVREPSDENFFAGLPGLGITDIYADARKNIRGYLQAPRAFVAADYNAIECRVLNWLAGEEWVLDLFRDGSDPYKAMAAQFFRVPVDQIDKSQRQLGKVGELSLGYQGGPGAVMRGAASYGMTIEPRDAEVMKLLYRASHPNVVSLWAKCEKAMRLAIEGHRVLVNAKLWFEPFPCYVRVRRPSGFARYYWHPSIVSGTWADGSPKEFGEIEYTGRVGAGVTRLRTYGGDIAQDVTQAVAADLMLEGMQHVETAGFDPVLSVHDEGVFEFDPEEWEGDVGRYVCEEMERPPKWAAGLPIKAEAWINRRFTK